MKKALSFVTVLVILAVAAALTAVYFFALRGTGPAFLPPAGNVAEEINSGETPLALPPSFSASIFAEGLSGPRVLTYDPVGNLLVSLTSAGKVVALPNRDTDNKADEIVTVIDGLNKPHGLTTRCVDTCKLYIAETDQVVEYDYDETALKAINGRKLLDLPDGGSHFTRTITFLPSPNDDVLLISVGSTCNACNEEDPERASILSYNLTTGERAIYASGLRNAVFMAIHPVDGRIWATEMGRDYLGDYLPPDEINIVEEGNNYGWPVCYGQNVHDTDFDKNVYIQDPCHDKTPSYVDLPAHVAPLGLAFIPEEGWPEAWWYDLLVAEHGSFNSTEPVGFKIVRLKLDAQGNYEGAEDFMAGWLVDGRSIGRPVDMIVQPGGVIYVSDDKAGVIYRVTYTPPEVSEEDEVATHDDLIYVTSPAINATVSSPLTVVGAARGNWYFEASFPVRLYDANGEQLAVGVAQAQSNWMTTEYVPFEVTLTFAEPTTGTGVLVLEKDNPSGLAEFDDELRVPVRFK